MRPRRLPEVTSASATLTSARRPVDRDAGVDGELVLARAGGEAGEARRIVEPQVEHARHRPADVDLRARGRGREQQRANRYDRAEQPQRRAFLTRTTRIGIRTLTTSPPAPTTRKITTRELR